MQTLEIRDVWAHNLEEELNYIRELVSIYPMVAMDTEFPGVVARPIGPFKSLSDWHYQTLRCNVDLLKIIQLGLTFSDIDGNLPDGPASWQFHFQFSLEYDMYAPDSIDLLTRAGIDFYKNQADGIDVHDFGEFLISSGIILNDQVRWISFHSGYDFGYILKMLTCQPLPSTVVEFHEQLKTYFPCFYDVKYLMRSCRNLRGGLNDVAEDLKVTRIGPQHQAGSDSLLTLQSFFRMKKLFFDNYIDDEKYSGILFGLGPNNNPNFLRSVPSMEISG
ncbi:CCR4-NOT transcription complex subunit 7-like [Schistocerca gregaria]|uniref:CCR4-NOT transcription complex subunit 7-like n=1 Tax=Schistocerca gregaria TaxID=7010 RepID=UPI00211DB676|nr:CCR4-NOT transcription complex subunit 7-like [Schistocerca gregaria]